jgi:ribosomal protein L32
MKQLLSLKQRGSVEEYQQQFEELSYQVAIQNTHYDEQFYVSQFIRGLKSELRAAVESQVPETVERAILLALVQQEILAEAKPWAQRQQLHPRPDPVVPRADAPRQAVKLGTGDMSKDRQLRDYRRAHNLCFKCGEPFNPAHQCARKPAADLHALTTEETPEQLSDEVLNMLEMQDLAEAQQLSLSIHALAGTESNDTIRLRAMVGNQVLLVLVDSGSTGSFLNSAMLPRLQCSVQTSTPVRVKLANGEELICDQIVPQLSWWIQRETFHTPMRVLPLGAYDAILGVDWLKKHGPITGD